MRLFRIAQSIDRALAFDGIGAALYPGRWNARGRRAVYVSSRIPLAILEVVVQSNTSTLAGYRVYPVDVPDTALSELDRTRLAASWRTMLGRDDCRALGEEWAKAKSSLGLIVPSAVVPEAYDFGDFDVVLDPEHHDFAGLVHQAPFPLDVDSRLAALVALPRAVPKRSRP